MLQCGKRNSVGEVQMQITMVELEQCCDALYQNKEKKNCLFEEYAVGIEIYPFGRMEKRRKNICRLPLIQNL